jgi:mRNA-degrading endonuclease RelE of RelBE toxin-antitoxin system
MLFKVYLSRNSLKSLKRLEKEKRERIKKILLVLRTTPVPVKYCDVRKIATLEEFYRIRVSDHRIIYKINWDTGEIDVVKISKRDEKTYRL